MRCAQSGRDLYRGFNPWDRIVEPSAVAELLREAGVEGGEAVAEAGEHPIPDPEASGIKAVEANVVYALARKP
jgi:hypothetical protein